MADAAIEMVSLIDLRRKLWQGSRGQAAASRGKRQNGVVTMLGSWTSSAVRCSEWQGSADRRVS